MATKSTQKVSACTNVSCFLANSVFVVKFKFHSWPAEESSINIRYASSVCRGGPQENTSKKTGLGIAAVLPCDRKV
jgi:hypothetical protein